MVSRDISGVGTFTLLTIVDFDTRRGLSWARDNEMYVM